MQELVNYFVDRLEAAACRVEELLTERFSGVLQHVRSVVARKKEAERVCQTSRGGGRGKTIAWTKTARHVLHQLPQWVRAVRVVGLNSRRYDLTVLKPFLMKRLDCTELVQHTSFGEAMMLLNAMVVSVVSARVASLTVMTVMLIVRITMTTTVVMMMVTMAVTHHCVSL